MKVSIVTTLAAVTVALGALGPSAVRAQAHTDHLMVVPAELTWADAPAVAPGAKIAVIEGPLNKAVPFTFRLRLPANAKIAPHTHPAYEIPTSDWSSDVCSSDLREHAEKRRVDGRRRGACRLPGSPGVLVDRKSVV